MSTPNPVPIKTGPARNGLLLAKCLIVGCMLPRRYMLCMYRSSNLVVQYMRTQMSFIRYREPTRGPCLLPAHSDTGINPGGPCSAHSAQHYTTGIASGRHNGTLTRVQVHAGAPVEARGWGGADWAR